MRARHNQKSKMRVALHGNAKAINIKQKQNHFTELAGRVKLELIRFVAWWRMAWGG